MKILTLYHGRNAIPFRFDYRYVGKGNDEEGPGFYLTDMAEDARRYGRFVYQVEATFRKLVPNHGSLSAKQQQEIALLIRAAPNRDETLQNWDENPRVAFRQAVRGIIEYTESPHDAFMQVWWDFYRDDPTLYLVNMVKLGYDGVEAPFTGPARHFVAFDPDKLEIIAAREF